MADAPTTDRRLKLVSHVLHVIFGASTALAEVVAELSFDEATLASADAAGSIAAELSVRTATFRILARSVTLSAIVVRP
eukprot:1787570-Prymnesium_polylepis.1